MRRTKFGLAGALAVVALAALVTVATGTARSNATIKAAWIYVGPHNDGGWSQAHDARPALGPEDARQERRHDLQGERPGRPAGGPGDREPHP